MIPEAAVEAAARVLLEMTGTHADENWSHEARAALEAAAPRMLAHAWDVGCESALMHIAPVNPHRGKA